MQPFTFAAISLEFGLFACKFSVKYKHFKIKSLN